MRKENQGLTEAGEFGQVPGSFIVRFPFFVVPGRGVLPHKRPEGANTCLLDAPFSAVRVGAYCIRPTNDPTGANSRRWEGPNFYRSAHITSREGATPPDSYILFLS